MKMRGVLSPRATCLRRQHLRRGAVDVQRGAVRGSGCRERAAGHADRCRLRCQLRGERHNKRLYIAWEDSSAGVVNVLLTASYDGGTTWTSPIQVNDNAGTVDEFQPNLAVAGDSTVSVNFYDRRLACPASGSAEAAGAGIALDQVNPNYSGTLPPYGASNYCVNASIQFYSPTLAPLGQNIRLTQHAWDPQLNAPHPGSPGGEETFIGDYFGNTTSGSTDISSFVSTYDDGSNPNQQQQQVIARVTIP